MPRLHLPLIEPGVRICRTRLSDGMREVGPQSGALRRLFAGPLVRSAGPDPVAEVLGNMATLRIVTASGTLPKSGPFPPPALPGLDGTMGLSDSPHGRACPSRASRWQAVLPPLGSPVLRAFSLCRHAIATTPAGSSQGSGCSLDFDDGGLPQMTAGSAPAVKTFRGLLGVHACYGLPARGVANATLCIEGFGSFVTSTTAPIATGWSNSCQVGIAPTEERRLSTAHGHPISFQPCQHFPAPARGATITNTIGPRLATQ